MKCEKTNFKKKPPIIFRIIICSNSSTFLPDFQHHYIFLHQILHNSILLDHTLAKSIYCPELK
jgi:hypothetical protein